MTNLANVGEVKRVFSENLRFPAPEREVLLTAGVGDEVVSRLERIGIHTFHQLKQQAAGDVIDQICDLPGSFYWRHLPLAHDLIYLSIRLACVHSR